MDRKTGSKNIDSATQSQKDLMYKIIAVGLSSIILVIIISGTIINDYSYSIGNKFCLDNGFDEATASNLVQIICTKWFNITLQGGIHEIRQDHYYFKLNDTWTLYKTYTHGWDQWKRGNPT